MLRKWENEMFTFEIDSEAALVGSTLERWRYPLISVPISEDLKLYWRLFAIGGIFKTSQPNCEMLASMQRGGRRPTDLANSSNLVLLDS